MIRFSTGAASGSLKWLVPLLLGVTLTGCGGFSPFRYTCVQASDFAAVEERPLLKVPPGKDAPDTRAALAIPPLERPEPPVSEQGRCLDEPPLERPVAPARPQA